MILSSLLVPYSLLLPIFWTMSLPTDFLRITGIMSRWQHSLNMDSLRCCGWYQCLSHCNGHRSCWQNCQRCLPSEGWTLRTLLARAPMKPGRAISTQEADFSSAPFIHILTPPHFDIWDEDRVQRFHFWLQEFEGYAQVLGELDDMRKKRFLLCNMPKTTIRHIDRICCRQYHSSTGTNWQAHGESTDDYRSWLRAKAVFSSVQPVGRHQKTTPVRSSVAKHQTFSVADAYVWARYVYSGSPVERRT